MLPPELRGWQGVVGLACSPTVPSTPPCCLPLWFTGADPTSISYLLQTPTQHLPLDLQPAALDSLLGLFILSFTQKISNLSRALTTCGRSQSASKQRGTEQMRGGHAGNKHGSEQEGVSAVRMDRSGVRGYLGGNCPGWMERGFL